MAVAIDDLLKKSKEKAKTTVDAAKVKVKLSVDAAKAKTVVAIEKAKEKAKKSADKTKAKAIVDAAKAKAKATIAAVKAKGAIAVEKAKAKAKKYIDDAKMKQKLRKQKGGLGEECSIKNMTLSTGDRLLRDAFLKKVIDVMYDTDGDDAYENIIKELLNDNVVPYDKDNIVIMLKPILRKINAFFNSSNYINSNSIDNTTSFSLIRNLSYILDKKILQKHTVPECNINKIINFVLIEKLCSDYINNTNHCRSQQSHEHYEDHEDLLLYIETNNINSYLPYNITINNIIDC